VKRVELELAMPLLWLVRSYSVIFEIPKTQNVLGRPWRYLPFYFTC